MVMGIVDGFKVINVNYNDGNVMLIMFGLFLFVIK